MAFRTYNNFYNILKKIASSQNSERFIAENFILEERLQKERQRAYMKNISDTCEEFGKWQSEHDNYLYRKIYIEHDKNEQPETFTNINGGNILNEIDENQYLVRLEDINSAIDLTDFLDNENRLSDILKLVSETGKLPSGNEQIQTLRDFFTSWNSKRDKRPIFAGFWGEIKDIFDNDDNNWANRLRDRLGIGHYDPEQWGENIPVLLLRYRVSEVLKYENRNKFSIPTVIDSGFSECFVPTSAASEEGQTLNLGVTDETAYYFNKEILHSFIEYKAEHIYRIGEIDAPPVGKCEEIRNFHLNLIGNRLKNIKEIR